MMELPPVVAPPPARPLWKLLPMLEMHNPGIMMKTGDRSDTGVLRKDDDGRYWAVSSAAKLERKETKSSEQSTAASEVSLAP